jgi:peptide/nickel transport system permease protein
MMIPVLIGVVLLIFVLMNIRPGDPVAIILGEAAPPGAAEALRAEMGLDRPLIIQFASYIWGAVRGDLGRSYLTRLSVFDEVGARFPTTLWLTTMTIVVSLILGIPLGILCAIKQYSLYDAITSSLGLVMFSIPNFWLGLMLIMVFSVSLRWLPVVGWDTPRHWVLPVVTLGLSQMGVILRFVRSSMLEVIRQDYIRTARAKGQKESVVIMNHALKNALIPTITITGLTFGGLLSGAILTETVFNINGIGQFLLQSIRSMDTPLVMGSVLLLAIAFVIVNLIVDIWYAYADPRVKSQYK